jgi:citrate lyase alpha subunit
MYMANLLGLKVILFSSLCALGACTHLARAPNVEALKENILDSNGLDERARTALHVQNIRMVLAALAYTQQQNPKAANDTLHDLLYSELSLLNGFDETATSKSVHKGLCAWRGHIGAAAEQLRLSGSNPIVQPKIQQLERTEQLLKGACN